jgi:hypothetical protein
LIRYRSLVASPLSFAYHQPRANGRPSDGLFRQHQALLRTLPTPSTVVADAVKLWWAWGKKENYALLRSLLLVILAQAFTVATVAASMLSSLIISSGTIDVLVNSSLCGRINSTGTDWRSYTIEFDRSATGYTQSCYKNTSLGPSCNVFMQPNIPLNVTSEPCPFDNAIAACDTNDAVGVDSGLLDVGKTFGLNLKGQDRVQYRKKTTCTILPIKDAYRAFSLEDMPGLADGDRKVYPDEEIVILYYRPAFEQLPKATFFVSLLLPNTSRRPASFG